MPKELDTSVCAFCGGKELAEFSVTGLAFPMGARCYKKAIRKGVTWNEDTTLKEIKSRLRFGEPLNSNLSEGR
jgi:hypothetical protein